MASRSNDRISSTSKDDDFIGDASSFRRYCHSVASSRSFSIAILIVIFMNTITLAAQTFQKVEIEASWQLALLDVIFFSIYLFELILKFYAWRLRYFKNSWNTFDFLVVLASTVDFLINLVVRGVGNFDTKVLNALRVFRVVRALRALRVLRTIRFLRNLQIIVTTILRSIPALGNIVILAALVLYIFAIIGRGLYGDADPARFGNLGRASVTLFQLITLDDWYYAYSERDDDTQHILLYLFIFIVLETFIFINLFVAVIVDSLGRAQAAADDQSATAAAAEAEAAHINDDVTDITSSQLLGDDGDSALSDGVDETTVRNYYDDVIDADFDLIRRYYATLASLEHHLKEDAVQREAIYELVDLLDIAKVPTRRN